MSGGVGEDVTTQDPQLTVLIIALRQGHTHVGTGNAQIGRGGVQGVGLGQRLAKVLLAELVGTAGTLKGLEARVHAPGSAWRDHGVGNLDASFIHQVAPGDRLVIE